MMGDRPADDGVPLHDPVIVTDGGPWCEHDMACAICRRRKAVIDLESGIFQPCWGCQRAGWFLLRHSPKSGARRRRWARFRREVRRRPMTTEERFNG
jgi:hypothetical protein